MTSTLLVSDFLPRLNSPTIRQLTSGLTIIAERMPVEATSLSVWLKIGSACEPDAINGMAHFLEHMVFKGTPQLPCGEFERLVEECGAVTNAATHQDYTHYYINTAPQDFASLVPLQLDVILNPSIPDADFASERLVVLEEIRRATDNPNRSVFYWAMETFFEQSPYRRPVLGPSPVIESLTPQQMRDFHAEAYHPSAMTVVAVGNLPTDQLIETVADSLENSGVSVQWADANNPPRPDSSRYGAAPVLEDPFTQKIEREFTDPRLQQARLVMAWRVPGLAELEQTYALDVLSSILGQGRTARLVWDLREERHLVSSISVSNLSYRLQGLFYISARLPVENIDAAEAAILEHIRHVQEESVTEAELNRVKTQVANRFIFANETPRDRANLYGYHQSMIGDLFPALNYPVRIQALDIHDLQQAAQQYLPLDAYGVVRVRP